VFQLLKYMVRIWERERVKQGTTTTLPIVIPVLFYHGTRKWRMPLDFASYFLSEEELSAHIPTFRPVMIDLQAMEDQDFRGSEMIQAVLKTLKYSRTTLGAYLVEIIRSAIAVPMSAKHRAFLVSLFGYILAVGTDIDEQDVDRAFRFVGSHEAKEAYMTLAEQLVERGMLKDKQKVLLKLLAEKFSIISKADKKKIEETKDPDKLDQCLVLIIKSESIEEILKPLDS
jgi:hypothetical protein